MVNVFLMLFSSFFAGAEGKCKYLEGLTRFHGQKKSVALSSLVQLTFC